MTPTGIAGIDASHWQGKLTLPPCKLRAENLIGISLDEITALILAGAVGYVVVKATEGASYIDPMFKENVESAFAAGYFVAAYHYVDPFAPSNVQIANIVRAITSVLGSALLPAGWLGVALDIEKQPPGIGPGALTRLCEQLAEGVQSVTGKEAIIYTTASYANTYMYPSDKLSALPLWVAEYGVSAPKLPAGWPKYTFWQWTAKEIEAGVSTPVDGDIFNGTLAELQALAGIV